MLALVIVEGAGHGSSVAAPIVGQLLRKYLEISEESILEEVEEG